MTEVLAPPPLIEYAVNFEFSVNLTGENDTAVQFNFHFSYYNKILVTFINIE